MVVVVNAVQVDVIRQSRRRLHGVVWTLTLTELQLRDAALPGLLEQRPHEERRPILDEAEGLAHVSQHLSAPLRQSFGDPV